MILRMTADTERCEEVGLLRVAAEGLVFGLLLLPRGMRARGDKAAALLPTPLEVVPLLDRGPPLRRRAAPPLLVVATLVAAMLLWRRINCWVGPKGD